MKRPTREAQESTVPRQLDTIRTESTSDGDGDLRKLLSAVLTAAVAATEAAFGNIQLVVPEDGSLRIVAHQGFAREFLSFFRYVKDDPSACSAALRDGRCTIVRDVARSELYTEPARRVMLAAQVRACQSTPILSSTGGVLGVISTHFRVPHRPTARQLGSVETLARYVAAVLEEVNSPPACAPNVDQLVDDVRDRTSGKTRILRGLDGI